MQDQVYRYLAADGNVRIALAQTTMAAEEASRIHNATPVAAAAMGRTLTMALLLASELKGDGSVSVSVAGGGPIGKVIAVARPDGAVKVYCSNPSVDLPPRPDGKLDVGGAVGRQGKLAVVKDLGMREPYIGQVNLVTGEIGEDFALYLAASEQQPSLAALGVLVSQQGPVLSAGGIVVQPLPGCPEETLSHLELIAPTLGDISRRLLDEGPDGVIQSTFRGMDPKRIGEMPVELKCDCSRDRIERALISLGGNELADMIQEEGNAEVRCHFCARAYDFTAEELGELRDQAEKGSEGE